MMNTTALVDIRRGIASFRLWQSLAKQDIRLKYRRSTLGPFWITLSMAVTVSAMGPLYGALFSIDLAAFVPHLALGLIFWAFIAGSLNEYAETFTANEHILKQSYLPLSALVMRVYYRQLLILLHNFMIYPVVMMSLGVGINSNIFWLLPAFVVVSLNILWLGLIIAIFCTRFRDMLPVIQSVVTLMFFVTPIIWKIEQLPSTRLHLAQLNPFTSLIMLLREPVLGIAPSIFYWQVAGTFALGGSLLALWVFSRTRQKITYWL
ncbi:MAG: ABC transporter permease [Cardiobacteriaceae bacterium]|nr:ABC transporter permease [Cardiobacteriaceae bacterium]